MIWIDWVSARATPTTVLGIAHMKLLRIRQVIQVTGLSRMTIYRLELAGKFPKRRQLIENSVGYLEADISQWLTRPVAHLRAASNLRLQHPRRLSDDLPINARVSHARPSQPTSCRVSARPPLPIRGVVQRSAQDSSFLQEVRDPQEVPRDRPSADLALGSTPLTHAEG
jgi:prophage regulatory protein